MKKIIYALLLIVTMNSCRRRTDPVRDVIELPSGVTQVADSISYLETLATKLPPTQVLGSFLDNEGYLYVNTEKIGLLEKASRDSTIRNSPVFGGFSDDDYHRFILITKFLQKNHIDGWMRDNASGLFIYEYRSITLHEFNDLRYVMLNVDTTSKVFQSNYRILDRSGKLVLVIPVNKFSK